MGWGFVHELSKHHELTVFVEAEKFKNDIERWLVDNENHSKINFIFVQKRRNRLLRKIWPPSYYFYYREWHRNVLKIAKQLIDKESYDLCHQLTMCGFREPGFFSELDIPFVWGPMGSMGYFPSNFLFHVGLKGFFYHSVYNFYNFFHMRFLSQPKRSAKKAGIGLLAATSENQNLIRELWKLDSTIITEIGIPSIAGTIRSSGRREYEPIKIVWSGLHISRKALNLAIAAVAQLPEHLEWELHILGSGELTAHWKEYAKRMEVADRCFFHGMIPRADALDIMISCHISLITSLRDLTSAVTIESISLGLPVICLDHCGFSDVIDESCGVPVAVTTFDKTTTQIANAIISLASDETLRQKLAISAYKKSETYSWDKKVEVLNKIYIDRLNRTND
jgi:glycosyltransferase involved in cell wall biosynthesis